MSILGNILWLIFGGLLTAIGWFLAGIICCITIIGIPIGLQCFKFAEMVIWPFGTEIHYGNLNSGSIILNVIWILLCGLELAMGSVALGIACCVTIIGIPFGIQHFKFAVLALMPFGAQMRRVIY
ncbi:Inner membrane protein YccF [anaerobic digester metagenome]